MLTDRQTEDHRADRGSTEQSKAVGQCNAEQSSTQRQGTAEEAAQHSGTEQSKAKLTSKEGTAR